MEWSWRTVLILIGLLVMVAILVDGFRRMRRARAEALRLDISSEFKFPEVGNSELPGSFRVIKHASDNDRAEQGNSAAEIKTEQREILKTADKIPPSTTAETRATDRPLVDSDRVDVEATEPVSKTENASHTDSSSAFMSSGRSDSATEYDLPPMTATDSEEDSASVDEQVIPWADDIGPARVVNDTQKQRVLQETPQQKIHDLDIPELPLIPKVRPVNLDESVPVLLDVEELGDEDEQPAVSAQEEHDTNNAPADALAVAGSDDIDVLAEAGARDDITADAASVSDTMMDDALSDYPDFEQEVEEIPQPPVPQPVNFAGPGAELLASRPIPELVLEIHCIAHDAEGFSGKDILYLFNSCDLRFGEKDIFHRFEDADGEGCIQFSVAQSFEPGIFVPAAMAQQHFRGLSFFMSMPGPKKPLAAYEAMSEMAQVVARNLKADLFDGARSALMLQTMEHDRQQISDYDRRQKLALKKQSKR